MVLVDFDTCECGDYRRDHVDGVGPCRLPNTLVHGYKPCERFRLSEKAMAMPAFFREHPEYLDMPREY